MLRRKHQTMTVSLLYHHLQLQNFEKVIQSFESLGSNNGSILLGPLLGWWECTLILQVKPWQHAEISRWPYAACRVHQWQTGHFLFIYYFDSRNTIFLADITPSTKCNGGANKNRANQGQLDYDKEEIWFKTHLRVEC